MNGVINLSNYQVALAFVFILIVFIIFKHRGIRKEKELIISSLRMTFQLVLVGYLLTYIFKNPNPIVTMIIIFLMEVFSVYTIFKKFKNRLSNNLKKVIALSVSLGTFICIIYFLLVVVRIKPWYNPQYLIPIAGMFIGNSMTGVGLGINSLVEGMTTKKEYIEEALILGATPKIASKEIINNSFDAAIMPTMNSMIGMGIVFLPGMMTGQILSGIIPTTAISYQIVIMLGILGSVSLSIISTLIFGYKTFFNKENQLNIYLNSK
ncbi:ABC transporter permease [Clostridium oceanicum]|uniref:Iron export ABC transporter permease subunit FetB n=1 Tax=Clostridium oceanicum TaxID=1543 RepID=A0ABP3UMS0_9CLOT